MKKILLFLTLLFIGYSTTAQNFDWDSYYTEKKDALDKQLKDQIDNYTFTDNEVVVQKIIDIKGSKNELFSKTMEILVGKYEDLEKNLQIEDKDTGLIIGKGVYSYFVTDIEQYGGSKLENLIKYTFKLDFKDDKARITCSLNYVVESRDAVIINGIEKFPASLTNVAMVNLLANYNQEIEYISQPGKGATREEILNWSNNFHIKRFSNLFGGYQFYYAINHLNEWVSNMGNQLQTKMSESDNW